jgi:hypothetical protein
MVKEVVDFEDDTPQVENSEEAQPKWYSSIEEFIQDVNTTSRKLWKHSGWKISIDEMLRKCKGRSAQTFKTERDTSYLASFVQ